MGKITFIVGGARSGKSTYAIEAGSKKKRKVAFIATCNPLDSEMKKRVELHKKSRPKAWKVYEESKDILSLIRKIGSQYDLIVIDCLTLYVSNLIFKKFKDDAIAKNIENILIHLKKSKANFIVVSNEVGLGVVPSSKLGRRFRDIAGRANQLVASKSNEVLFMAAGLPMKLKG